jgi:ABC-type multidrug transport system fused ATPase/permease subunit
VQVSVLIRFSKAVLGTSGPDMRRALSWVTAASILEGAALALLAPALALALGQGDGPAAQLMVRLANGVRGLLGSEVMVALGVIGVALGFVARAAINARRDLALNKLQTGFVASLRGRLTESLAQANWDAVSRLNHADVSHTLFSDTARVSQGASSLLTCLVALAMLLVQAMLAVAFAPLMALIGLFLLLAGGLIVLRRPGSSAFLGTRMVVTGQAIHQALGGYLDGLKVAVSQNLQTHFSKSMLASIEQAREAQFSFQAQQAHGRFALMAVGASAGAMVALGGHFVLGLAAGSLVAFLVVLVRAVGPATQLVQSAQQLSNTLPSWLTIEAMLARLEAATAQEASNQDIATQTFFATPSATIVFDRVTRLHQASSEGAVSNAGGVREISMRIDAGSMVGVLGPSGTGKTTLADLMVGLLIPDSGSVTIPEIDGSVASAQWRSRVAYVTQDPHFTAGTLAENLTWGTNAPTPAEIDAALVLTGADRLIRRDPLGLQQELGEHGRRLSGGERQRLALSRALLRRPALLVLDEATNALDLASEASILSELARLKPRPTIFLITHRKEAALHCDRLIEISEGRIVSDQLL